MNEPLKTPLTDTEVMLFKHEMKTEMCSDCETIHGKSMGCAEILKPTTSPLPEVIYAVTPFELKDRGVWQVPATEIAEPYRKESSFEEMKKCLTYTIEEAKRGVVTADFAHSLETKLGEVELNLESANVTNDNWKKAQTILSEKLTTALADNRRFWHSLLECRNRIAEHDGCSRYQMGDSCIIERADKLLFPSTTPNEGGSMIFQLTESIMNGTVTMSTTSLGVKAKNFNAAILKLKNRLCMSKALVVTANKFHFTYTIGSNLIGRLENKELKII